jgi:NAD(P)-dependent dehydrogenase (short-subunit alcohol dehydrogenase family)
MADSYDCFSRPHVSLVTGGSTGIGAATAVELARCGSDIALHYNKSRDKALAVAERVRSLGREAEIFQADLSQGNQCRELVDTVLTRMSRIDVLVNNAGSMVGRKLFSDISEDFWQQVIDTNVGSMLWVSQPVASHMIERRQGTIVNVSSVAARNGGSPGVLAYAAAKAALLCMTKSMAKELIGSGVRVNCVNPGVIDTPFHERFTPPERMQAMVAGIPQERAGSAEEVARVIRFLAGPDASYLVGESVEVNGGLWMG